LPQYYYEVLAFREGEKVFCGDARSCIV